MSFGSETISSSCPTMMRNAGLADRSVMDKLAKVDARNAAHVLEALQREISAGEHPFHARLAQSEPGGDGSVRHPSALQHALERVDQRDRIHIVPLGYASPQSHAAPRTPLESPCAFFTSRVSTRSENTHG